MPMFDFIRLVPVTIIIPLLVVCHLVDSVSPIVSFEDFAALPEENCVFGGSREKTYNYFVSAFLTNVSFDPAKGWSLWVRENCNPNTNPSDCQGSRYNLESVRYFAANSIKPDTESMCTYCPYHLDPITASEDTLSTQAGWSEPHPMYGPCLNGLAPKRMVCLQHHAIKPPKFVGKYHYPKQKALSAEVLGAFADELGAFPIHQFLDKSATASPYSYTKMNDQMIRINNPSSDYGLGESAVNGWLNKLEFRFTNGTVDNVSTANLRRDFTRMNNVEQWMKYAQYYCQPACHKYDRASIFRVRNQDVMNDAELSYLSFYLNHNEINRLFGCRPCPTYFASYYWDSVGSIHPRLNILADQCYPWFGAIPSMIPFMEFYIMNSTLRKRSRDEQDTGKIIEPESDVEVHPLVCPINTFNRVCAHTKESIYTNAKSTNNSDMLKQYQCSPCPPGGYHTGGKTGQWYCLPPAGRLFERRDWLKKEPRAWGDRDYMALYNFPELECGPFEEYCKQCEDYNVYGDTPEVFNEKFIFERLLSETICDVGFYCPDPYSKIACPAERPWSPEGSGFLSNCTCAAGKYLDSTTSLCMPCTSSCQHLPGFYLPASQCMLKNGATADAPCLRCDNLPTARAVADGAGRELRAGVGACPYHCIFGSELDQSTNPAAGLSLAEKKFVCRMPSARKNANNMLVYNPSLQPMVHVDRITFSPATSSRREIWSLALAFSDSLEKINTPGQGWMEQPTSCLGGAACTVSQICYAENQPASLIVDDMIAWYSFAAMVNCTRCPLLADLPEGSYLMSSANMLPGRSICQSPQIFCNSTFYFDRASWSCQSCVERQRVICPPNTRLRAAGCMNRFAAFNLTVPSADCQSCPLDVPDFNVSRGRFFLNYQNESSSAVGGCSMDACLPLPSGFFWRQQCGADYGGQQSRCRPSCHPYEFREAICSATADLQCRNCTLGKAGFQMTEVCTLTSDSRWSVCQAGFFCDESGEVARCPVNRTSLPGARSVMDCFCMAGMQESSTGGTCEPYQCEGTVMSSTLPGRSLVSLHYMTINPLTKSTICLPCNTNGQSSALANTRGSGVHVTSCVCPSGFYGVYANSSRLSIQCTPCPTSPSCLAPRNLPLSCAEGDIKLMPQDRFPCACAVAPFTNPNPNCGSAFSCVDEFQSQQQRSPLRGLPRVSGSSGHSVNRQPFRSPGAWKRLLISSPNTVSNVQAFAISGLMDETFLGNSAASQNSVQSFHYEYVFWIVEDALIPVIYAALLDPDTTDLASRLILKVQQGLVNVFETLPKAIGIATSKWRLVSEALPYTMENRIPWLFVGVLFRNSHHGLFYLTVRVFNGTNTNPSFVGAWEPNDYNMSLFPSNYNGFPEAIPVAMGYGTQVIGQRTGVSPGYFYIAFNSVAEGTNRTEQCGGVIMKEVTTNPSNAAVIMDSFCADTSERITGMVVSLAPDTKAHYIILALSSGMVFKILSLTNPRIPDTSVIPAISGASELHNLGLAFSVGSLMYITGVSSETLCQNGQHCFRVADSQQMSWVELQGLPWGSSSNPWPMSMGVSLTSRSEAILVVSSGPSLFTITFNRCLSPDEYWDGVACARHSCIKQTPCNAAMIRNEAGNCVCRNGFWAAVSGTTMSCQICSASSFFCEGGVRRNCPDGTMTQMDGASSVNNCICPINGQFFAQSLLSPSTRCTSCQAGDTWCPNRWLSLSCPGNKRTLLTPPSAGIPVSPIHCQCAGGFTGPGCVFCPDGFYCPDTSRSLATNLAVYYTFAQTPLTDLVLGFIRAYFQTYFSVPATRPVNYNPNALDLILYIQAVPLSNRTSFGIMVMIQVEGSASQFTAWPSALQDYLLQRRVNVTGRDPLTSIPYSMQVPVNRPLQCMVSKVPDPSAVSCICAPGFESRGEQCSACPVNTFKANSGTGSCVSCPLGRIAPVKATACILDPTSSSSSTAQNAGGPDIGLLVGGIGGGVVGLILLIFVMQYFFKQSNK